MAATELLSYSEAAELVRSYSLDLMKRGESAGQQETAALAYGLGRVLDSPLRADRDQPPFPRSTRDGYACRASEANSHQFLEVSGQVRAGQESAGAIGPGEAWEIMTGAPVPEGADAVFMVEHAERVSRSEGLSAAGSASDRVRLAATNSVQPGEHVVPAGAEARRGDLLVPAGMRITPAQIATAAQCGYSNFCVAPRARVAILSTGDELVAVETIPGPSQIRNSNAPMLGALVTAAGGIPLRLPTVPDRELALDEALRTALSSDLGADMLLITGGISAGRFDLVKEALERAGASFHFIGVAIQPGKPVAFGEIAGTLEPGHSTQRILPVLALPGNPISSAVTFHLFASPLLAAVNRDLSSQPRFAIAEFRGEWRGKPGLTRFLPAVCDFGFHPRVELTQWQGSGDIAALARSNCFLVIPAKATEILESSSVQVLLA